MIEIRQQIDSDAEDVKFITAVTTDELRTVYRPVKPFVKNKNENNNEKTIYIVAVVNENVVGIAEYVIYDNSILIRGLAVSPMHRRQGVAKAIIDHITLCAKKDIRTQLTLSTIKETGNTHAFLHMGFTIDSEEISEKFEGINGEQVTIVKMTKNYHK
ncbi:MAG: GNAT family N-acetyltransferase [Gammaproteobacteria bacterium]|nr:GNAT family N-acetyltransferase [Gammaproteobacteria bacterium]